MPFESVPINQLLTKQERSAEKPVCVRLYTAAGAEAGHVHIAVPSLRSGFSQQAREGGWESVTRRLDRCVYLSLMSAMM